MNNSKKKMIISNLISVSLMVAVGFGLLYCLGITGISAVGITTALATLGTVFNRKMLGGLFVLSEIVFVIKSTVDWITMKLPWTKDRNDKHADA